MSEGFGSLPDWVRPEVEITIAECTVQKSLIRITKYAKSTGQTELELEFVDGTKVRLSGESAERVCNNSTRVLSDGWSMHIAYKDD